jgi:hypothetical protein
MKEFHIRVDIVFYTDLKHIMILSLLIDFHAKRWHVEKVNKLFTIRIISLKRELSFKLLGNLCTVLNLLEKRHFCSQHETCFNNFFMEVYYAFCNRCWIVKTLRKKKEQILKKKYIGRKNCFSVITLIRTLVFFQTKCFDLVLKEFVLLRHVFKKKSFLTFNSESLLHSFATEGGDSGESCYGWSYSKRKNIDTEKKRKNC